MSTPSREVLTASHAVMARHARSFRLASWFLAPAVRDDAAVLYAFCRAVDDAVDEAPDEPTARARLGEIEASLRDGVGLGATVRELAGRRGVPLEAARELIEGARSDLGEVRIRDDEALLHYAYLVAGTVGSMMFGVLGARDEAARARAIDLGIAMQITNICRDVAEDAHMGRVYLPATRLAAVGTSHAEVLAGTAPRRALACVVSDLLDLAERHYASADVGTASLPPRSRLGVLVASRVYRAIGARLRAEGCDPMKGRVVVPPAGKAAWTLAALGAWLAVGVGLAGDAASPWAEGGAK